MSENGFLMPKLLRPLLIGFRNNFSYSKVSHSCLRTLTFYSSLNDFVGLDILDSPINRYSLATRRSFSRFNPSPSINTRPSSDFLSRLSYSTNFISTSERKMATAAKKHKVTIIGSGNWGSAIAKIVAENTDQHPSSFEREVQMYVYEEDVTIPKSSKHYDPASELAIKPQKLTTLINRLHENVKYLPGINLPENIVANPNIEDAVKDSTILVFNLPHQFLRKICESLKGKITPYARAISCIKGVDVSENSINLFSETISTNLGIYCGALSGANIANEVALEKFSETTIAYDPPHMDSPDGSRSGSPSPKAKDSETLPSDKMSKKMTPMPAEYTPLTHALIGSLFHRPYFHVRLVRDVAGVSLGGALKNIVALAAGFVDGMGWGDNSKAAVMRVGILEQVKFGSMFFPDSFEAKTMTEESCGVADMITSCASGRNFRSGKMSVERGVTVAEIEQTEMNGQKLQGASTAEEVRAFLKAKNLENEFPLFVAVDDILHQRVKPQQLPDLIEQKAEEK